MKFIYNGYGNLEGTCVECGEVLATKKDSMGFELNYPNPETDTWCPDKKCSLYLVAGQDLNELME